MHKRTHAREGAFNFYSSRKESIEKSARRAILRMQSKERPLLCVIFKRKRGVWKWGP